MIVFRFICGAIAGFVFVLLLLTVTTGRTDFGYFGAVDRPDGTVTIWAFEDGPPPYELAPTDQTLPESYTA